jgi:polyphenol oxidase
VSASVADAGVQALNPVWPAPARVRAAFTLRSGGVSAPPFDTLNVGAQVGDDAAAVTENRRRVQAQLSLPAEPAWIEQVHGTGVVDLDLVAQPAAWSARADGILTRRAGRICVVQVADCLPVLFAAIDGSVVAAAHAGWRGLAAGVLEATIAKIAVEPARLLAWLGPAIGPEHFEVGEEVRSAFTARDAGAAAAFTANSCGRWHCDLVALAQRRLAAAGVIAVFGGSWCTYADRTRFFSYRRDGRCGRMAALIWLD